MYKKIKSSQSVYLYNILKIRRPNFGNSRTTFFWCNCFMIYNW